MADRGDTHYFTPNLNRWFLVSSLLLLVTTAWMVIDDYNAGWKEYQREFRSIELERAEAELASANAQQVIADEERATEELQRATDQLAAKESEIEELEAELTQLEGNLFVSLEAAKTAKQAYNWERYLVEEERLHEDDPELGAERLAEYEQAMIDAAYLQQTDEIALAAAKDRMAALMMDVSEAEARLKQAGKAIELTLTGDKVGADEARRLGLVNDVVTRESLLDEAKARMKRITILLFRWYIAPSQKQ